PAVWHHPGHAADAGHAPPGPIRHAAAPGAATIPGLPGGAIWQAAVAPSAAAAGPAAGAAAGPADEASPRLQPAFPPPAGRSAPAADAAAQGGAWIPGLPGEVAEAAWHPGNGVRGARHGSYAARHGTADAGAGHGTDLSPTGARRLSSGGRPP